MIRFRCCARDSTFDPIPQSPRPSGVPLPQPTNPDSTFLFLACSYSHHSTARSLFIACLTNLPSKKAPELAEYQRSIIAIPRFWPRRFFTFILQICLLSSQISNSLKNPHCDWIYSTQLAICEDRSAALTNIKCVNEVRNNLYELIEICKNEFRIFQEAF